MLLQWFPFVCPLLSQFTTLRPSSADFPKLAVRSKVGPPKEIRESEKVVDEKVTRRTEEYLDEVTGERRVRTVEYVEKLIERQVYYTCKIWHERQSIT